MPPAKRTSAPVERHRNVVPSRIGSHTFPKDIPPIFVRIPHRQSHHAVSDAAVIHIPQSSPVLEEDMGTITAQSCPFPGGIAVNVPQQVGAHPRLPEAWKHIGKTAEDHGDGKNSQALDIAKVQSTE